jgi:TPR repeat protein
MIDKLNTNPSDVDSMIRCGVLFMQDAHGRRGPEFDRWMNVAKYELSRAVALAPNDFYARHNYGEALFEGGEVRPLEGEQAKFNPQSAAARSNHPIMRQAVTEFTAAIEINTRSARSYAGRGFALLEMGDSAGSQQDMARAIQLDPTLRNEINAEAAAIGEKKTHDAACKAQDSRQLVGMAEQAFDQRGNARQDASTAVGYLQRAADCGDVEAEFDLAIFHERGIGFSASYDDARTWLLRAAHDGEIGDRPALRAGAQAYHALAVYAWQALGEPRDLQQAIRYFQRAQRLADNSSAVGGSAADGYYASALANNPNITTWEQLDAAAGKLVDKDMLELTQAYHKQIAECMNPHPAFSQLMRCPAGTPAGQARQK